MVKTLYLDGNEHAVTMLQNLKQMRQEKDQCDFVIKVGRNEYHTHKNILSAGSPYFRAMLKHGTKESIEGKVEMKDVDGVCVKNCINCLYSGNIEIPEGKVAQLLHVAVMLQLDKVTEAISNYLIDSLTAESYYEIRDIARLYNLDTMSENCLMYFEENILSISSQPEFENEEVSFLVDIFKSKNAALSDEEKLTVSLRWVGKHSDRKRGLFELFRQIELTNVPSEYLNDLLDTHPVITNDRRLCRLVNSAKMKKISCSDDLIVLFDFTCDCIQSYNPKSGRLTKLRENFQHFPAFSPVSLGSYLYIISEIRTVYRLNFGVKNSEWERMQDMNFSHGTCPAAVSCLGSLFVVGNSGIFNQATNVVEKFVPASNKWSQLIEKPAVVLNATLVSCNDSIYCIGGWDSGIASNSFCRFTPSSSEWVDLELMKTGRSVCAAVAVERRIFVLGGCKGFATRLSTMECYDIDSRQWTWLSPMNELRGDVIAHNINSSVFIVNRWGDLSRVEKYNIRKDEWYKMKL